MNPISAREDTIVQEVTIHAAADRIFEALTQPSELVRWWGVEGKFRVTQMESDLRPGGKWRMHVKGSDGRVSTVAGEYRRIERPHLLVFTWVREQESMPETLVQWQLEERDGLTRVRMTHSGLNTEELRKRHSGWPMILDLLKAHVEDGPKNTQSSTDFRLPTVSKWAAPRAVADGVGGTIIAVAEIAAPPERVFEALTTDEVERWWGHPDYYHQTDWNADLRVSGEWRVTVRFKDGSTNGGNGEFAEIDRPCKLVMTRKFEKHPLQGTRETTITYRLEPVANGTRLTMREEGYIGRSEAAYGNAEHWERVLGWLDTYMRRTQ